MSTPESGVGVTVGALVGIGVFGAVDTGVLVGAVVDVGGRGVAVAVTVGVGVDTLPGGPSVPTYIAFGRASAQYAISIVCGNGWKNCAQRVETDESYDPVA